MSEADDKPNSHGLWTFSLSVYSKPEVQRACLALQHDDGLDVNLVLACAWLGHRGVDPETSAEAIADARGTTHALHHDVIVSLRQARTALKPMLGELPEQVRGRASTLREGIKRLEVSLERVEQDLLFAVLQKLADGQVTDSGRAHLEHYLAAEGRTLSEGGESMFQVVLEAATQVA